MCTYIHKCIHVYTCTYILDKTPRPELGYSPADRLNPQRSILAPRPSLNVHQSTRGRVKSMPNF